MTHRRQIVLGSAAWLIAASAGAATKRAKGAGAKKVALVDDGAPDVVTYGLREDVVRFAEDVAERRELDVEWVKRALAQARFIPVVTRYIMPPTTGTAKNWAAYRARFVEPIRIRAGVAFWRAHQRWLAQAEDLYGVPPEIVVGIVGVESIFGRQMGDFRVIDALATLSFDFPSGRKDRSAFFKDELEAWFVLCKSEAVDPLAWRGSYAGALGMAQFMPSSFNKYAVDFDGDGHVDLHANAADVIGSVANYLAEFGWKRGLPARFDVRPPTDTSERAALARARHRADLHRRRNGPARRLAARAGARRDSLLALVELQNGDAAPTYVAGTTNFYALTRYNWSSYYAMAVLALGEAVRPLAR
jgi:membrane-bound lytic murein transglycosylase B